MRVGIRSTETELAAAAVSGPRLFAVMVKGYVPQGIKLTERVPVQWLGPVPTQDRTV